MTPSLREQKWLPSQKRKKKDTGKLQHRKGEFQVEIQNKFATLALIPPDDLDPRGDAITNMIPEATISIAGKFESEKPNKLSTDTKQLKEKRKKMERNGTPMDNIEYSEICKTILQKTKEDIHKYDKKQTIKEIENRKKI